MQTTTEDLIRTLNSNHAEIKEAARATDARLSDLEQKSARYGRTTEDTPDTWGRQVAGSEGYSSFLKGGMAGRSSRIEVKGTLTTNAASAGALIATDHRPEVALMGRRRLTVRALLAPGRTGSNLVEYPRQITRTINADVVSETTQKPESVLEFEMEQAPVRTIAHWIPVSRQALADAAQLQSLIDSELRYGLAYKEETQLLTGDGTGENLEGLVTAATAFSPTLSIAQETRLDVLLQAIAQVQQSTFAASGIIVNDQDWLEMLAYKDNEGRYLAQGPFGMQPNVAWTLPVVPTPAMASGSFLVGGFDMAAQIFDREDPTIYMSDSHSDFFIKNLIAVLCEQRLAMTIKRPQALVSGTYDQVSG